jgi:hypothetical protein
MENLIERALRYSGSLLPQSPSFHKDLLDRAVEQQVISQELSEELDATQYATDTDYRSTTEHATRADERSATQPPKKGHLQ